MGTKKDKFIKIRINADDERLFREASIHIYGEENLSKFLRDGGFSHIKANHGTVCRRLDDNYEATGERYLRFVKPYVKKRRKHYAY